MSAGTLFGAGKKGDSVWLFSLAGKIESIPIARRRAAHSRHSARGRRATDVRDARGRAESR